jgi:hypothetical protein
LIASRAVGIASAEGAVVEAELAGVVAEVVADWTGEAMSISHVTGRTGMAANNAGSIVNVIPVSTVKAHSLVTGHALSPASYTTAATQLVTSSAYAAVGAGSLAFHAGWVAWLAGRYC